MMILVSLLMLNPCTEAVPVTHGNPAPCSGVILGADQVKKTLRLAGELKVRKVFKCPECPACPACPKAAQQNTWAWGIGGAFAGALFTVILSIGLASVF